MSSQKKRESFIKLYKWDLEALALSSSKKQNYEERRKSETRQNIEMIPMPPALFVGLEDYVGAPPRSTRKSLAQPQPKRKMVGDTYGMRGYTLSRKSNITKKEMKSVRKSLISGKAAKKDRIVEAVRGELGANQGTSQSGARKQLLFKLPVPSSRLSVTTNTKAITKKFVQVSKWNKRESVDFSPLIDIEKADELLKTKGYIKGSPLQMTRPIALFGTKKDVIKNSPSTSGTTVKNGIEKKYPSPDLDFEHMEKICEEQEKGNFNDKIKEIRQVLERDEEEFQKFKNDRKKRMLSITKILNQLEACIHRNETEKILYNKENISSPEENMSTPAGEKAKKSSTCTPKSSNRAYDMRINLLKQKIASQKSQKAHAMYNKLRQNFTVLETPTFGQSQSKFSNTKNLSLKLQEQCLLLLDTPRRM